MGLSSETNYYKSNSNVNLIPFSINPQFTFNTTLSLYNAHLPLYNGDYSIQFKPTLTPSILLSHPLVTQIARRSRPSFQRHKLFLTCVLVGKFSWNTKLIGIQSVVQCGICPGVTFSLLTILWRFWTSIFPCWLDTMYQSRSSVYVTRISLGSMIYADVLSTLSRRLIFAGPVIALGLIGKSLLAVKSELMKHTRRPSISLVSETSMFSWTSSPLISGGPLLSLLC